MRKSSYVKSFGQFLNRSTNFSLEPFESIVILHLQFFGYIEVVLGTIVVGVDDAKSTIGGGYFQGIQKVPSGTPEVVGCSV